MSPDRSSFTALNLPSSFSLPVCMDYFTLSAGPNTDLWRKPPNGDTSTAPMVFTSLRRPFVVAEVTISADWEMEWDQGGLVIFAGDAPSQSLPTESLRSSSETTGMEFSSGTVNAASVSATSDGADWCLSPLAMPNIPTNITSLRIKLERVGYSLWIWYQIPSLSPYAVTPGAVGSTWKKLREVTWFFYGVEDKCVHVGVYASRPTSIQRGSTMWEAMNGMRIDDSTMGGGGDRLVVEFEDLEIF
ncbi:conserved hypothetical protein [Talaromyces marneffei ATCC 18224]|uniref:Uncharacterized protein n=1 Tax=Talaromyces marneffei (strain ATCC 18224 / CBS 334.59 / QM 7333) TaxID=441960 RepID=B6Q6N3_TALMQ|nr:conserved hypothetical protein [Talaromyces marneffei ATCC 18224]